MGERIKRARLARGLTQQQLAEGLATKGFISQVERDRATPSLPKLRLISERLGVPMSALTGERPVEQLTYLRKSAALALRAHEPERALQLVEEAVGLPATANERADLLRVKGIALSEMHQQSPALTALHTAVATAPPDDPELQAAIYAEIGTVHQLEERFNSAVEANLRALELLERCKHADPTLRARLLTNLGSNSYHLGQSEQALIYYGRALNAATDAESLRWIANAHMALGLAARANGHLEDAIEHCTRALEMHGRINQQRAVNIVLNNLGDVYYTKGDLKQARAYQQQSLERGRGLNDDYAIGLAATELARYALDQRRWSEALALAEEGVAASGRYGDHLHQAVSLAIEGSALDALGRPRKAKACFEQAFSLLLDRQALGKLAEVCVLYSDVLRSRGAIDRAFAFMRVASERDFKNLPALLRPTPAR